jgi:hypothetical protein
LIALAEAEGFQAFVTADRGVKFQQNPEGRHIASVFLTAQDWDVMSPHLDTIATAVHEAQEGSFCLVDRGRFSRS